MCGHAFLMQFITFHDIVINMNILMVTILTFVSSVIGTMIGGLFGMKAAHNAKILAYLLSFSSGLMLAMVTFDFMPHSIEHISVFYSALIIIMTICIMLFFEAKIHHHDIDDGQNINDLHHHHHLLEHINERHLIRASLIMVISVAIHNFPEGLAIGSSYLTNANTSLLLAILLLIHNVPEGMGMILPLIKTNIAKTKALLFIGSAGIATIIGSWVGITIGQISETFISICLSVGSGCMLYVIFFELLPQVQLNEPSKKTILLLVIGFVFGFILLGTTHLH